jgi:hypothetical protein
MKNIKKIILFTSVFFILIYCKTSFAASLYFSDTSKDVKVGDTFIVDVKLSSDKENINVADCSIFFDQNILQVSSVSTGGSIFNLWTRNPIFSNESGKIMFTGGIPNGYGGKDGNVIKIIFFAKSIGAGSLVFSDESTLYLNDGKGTVVKPEKASLKITVLDKSGTEESTNEWKNILSSDKTLPEKINIKLGRDESMFDNKFFITFSAIDKDSGIKSYEIKEGDADFLESESPYVLKDQSLDKLILVKVIDNAGNYKIIEFNPKSANKYTFTKWQLIVLILIIIIAIFYIKTKRKNAKNK